MYTHTEENYLKTIFHLSGNQEEAVSTNALAESLCTKASSVSDMLKKLSQKKLIHYVKYQGVTLTRKGRSEALHIVRKHRLWEVFLVQVLGFSWDEVHEIAEQLEHIHSPMLIDRLDDFLGFPTVDPHGDPIPNAEGKFVQVNQIALSDATIGTEGKVLGLQEDSSSFLKYLDKLGIEIGTRLKIKERIAFDQSVELELKKGKTLLVSAEVARNILIQPL
jgi:DtxR family Mn-dependent transcriptional regulator